MNDEEERALWRDALALDRAPREPVPAETVWRAVNGELPSEELEPLIDRLQDDPDLQLAWRLAREVKAPSRTSRRWWWGAGLVAAAAVVLLVVGVRQPGPRPQDVWRGDVPITTTLAPRELLPRGAFVLRWEMPEGARARVELRDEALDPLATSPWLDASTWTVPVELLEQVPTGGVVIWRVTVQHDGTESVSRSFVQRIGPAD